MTQDPHDLPDGAVDGTPPADPVLRRMLDAAPDRDAAPHPATREAILRTAHNAVAPSPLTASQPRDAAQPWWKRLWGGTPGSRMPWNAAFATVLVALFVTVLWHREPVPDARLDAEAPAASPVAPVPTPAPAPAPAAPAPPAASAVAPPAADSAPPTASASRPSATTPREREPAGGTDARATREERRSAAEADATSKQRAVAKPAAKAQAESLAERRELQSSPPAVAAAPAPITVAPGAEANLAPSPAGAGAPAAARAPSVAAAPRAAPAAPAAAARERAFGDAALAERAPSPAADVPFGAAPAAGAGQAGSPTPPPPPLADLAPAPAREAAAPPAALARRALPPAARPGAWRGWTHLRIVDASGPSRRLARTEAAQLGALVEAAIPPSGGGGAAADAPVPGWRIVLEGARGATLGVLEVPAAPGRMLRWREGTAPPVAAEPPPAVLDALRRALAER